MRKDGLMSALASVAMLAGGISGFGHQGGGSIMLPLGVIDTQEDRERRNLVAGGRDKRVKKLKARKSFVRRRSPRGRGTPRTDGRIFLSDKRHAAFLYAMESLLPVIGKYEARRAQAIKVARQVAA